VSFFGFMVVLLVMAFHIVAKFFPARPRTLRVSPRAVSLPESSQGFDPPYGRGVPARLGSLCSTFQLRFSYGTGGQCPNSKPLP
jgi:hypothetical protein